jgi:hypothetical protein
MTAAVKAVLLIVWALWLGGVMGLFLSVQTLFHQTDRAVFLASAPRLFIAFERYQFILAAVALVSCMIGKPPRLAALIGLFGFATVGAVIETASITPRIENLRILGQTHTPEFLRLHGLSMCIYMAIAIALLLAGIVQSIARKSA